MFGLKKKANDDPAEELKQAVSHAGRRPDFLPEGYLEKRRRRRTNAIMLLLFVIVVAVFGATFSIAEKSLASAEREYAKVEKQFLAEARRIEQVKQMRTKQKQVADQAELTASLLEKLPRSNLLAELTNGLPEGVSLTTLDLKSRLRQAPAPKTKMQAALAQKANPQQPQVIEYDIELDLKGIAYTDVQVAQYISALNRSDFFSSVDLQWIEQRERDETVLREFAIVARVDPKAEAGAGDAAEATVAIEVAPAD